MQEGINWIRGPVNAYLGPLNAWDVGWWLSDFNSKILGPICSVYTGGPAASSQDIKNPDVCCFSSSTPLIVKTVHGYIPDLKKQTSIHRFHDGDDHHEDDPHAADDGESDDDDDDDDDGDGDGDGEGDDDGDYES